MFPRVFHDLSTSLSEYGVYHHNCRRGKSALTLQGVLLTTTWAIAGLGSVATATHQVAMAVWTFLAYALDAVAIAAQTITGEALGAGGVVRDPGQRAEAVLTVARAAAGLGLGTTGVGASPLPGPSGNVEYFLHLRAGAPGPEPEDVERAVAAGPR